VRDRCFSYIFIAGVAYGSAYPTYDFDVLYAREERNLERMAAALTESGVTLRGAPPDLPFQPDARTLAAGCNFTFVSEYGSFDILGEAAGMRDYAAMRADRPDRALDILVIGGGLLCEGEGDNVARLDTGLLKNVRHALRDHLRLARARIRRDE